MNRQIITSIALIFYFAPQALQAQGDYTITQINDALGHLDLTGASTIPNTEITGSPYLWEDFRKGDLYYEGKFKIPGVLLNLNLYNDEFEYRQKNTVLAFAEPEKLDKISVIKENYMFIRKNSGTEVSGFVKMWNDKMPSVATKMKIVFRKKTEPKPYVEAKPDRFERVADKHYIMKSEKENKKITSIKKLIKYLGSHESELSSYAKKENISASDPKELAKLIDYYSKLQESSL